MRAGGRGAGWTAAGLWLGLGGAVARAAPAVAPAPVTTWIDVPEAILGPSDESCGALQARAAAERGTGAPVETSGGTVRGQLRPFTPAGGPFVAAAVPDPVVRWAHATAGLLPGAGGMPPDLQPLEGDLATLRALGDVLRAAEAGRPVRVTVYGASHTGGDFFTGHLRRELQRRYGDRGHGWVLPASLYQGYRGHDINLCSSAGWRSDWVGRRGGRADGLYGPGGASVASADPADFGTLETTRSNPQGRSLSKVELFTLGQPAGGGLVLTVDDTPARTVSTHADRPGLQRHVVQVPAGAHRLTVRPAGDGEVRIFGASVENEGPGVIVDAVGIRGRTARSWLDWDEALWQPGLAALAPDMVVLAYGTNEAADRDYAMDAYREDLREVLRRMRAVLPDAPCVLVGPSDRGVSVQKHKTYKVWGRTALVAGVQRAVAPEFGCAFWDWQQAQGGPGAMVSWRAADPPLAGWDLIHFSQAGYTRSAELFLEAWLEAAALTGGGVAAFADREPLFDTAP